MSTKGYNSYHGRMSTGKKILIFVLSLVLVLALAVLAGQNYLVYDDEGHVHLELPFLKDKPAPEETPEPEDVDITWEEPQRPVIDVVQAQELSTYVLTKDVQTVLAEAPETVVINIKLSDGSLTYLPSYRTADGVKVGTALNTDNLKAILASDRYTVARISCFLDPAYAAANLENAALQRDDKWLWYDNDAKCWLDPAKPDTLTYIAQVCQECAQLGFDEILLDYFGYPTAGRLDRILNASTLDKTAPLGPFLEELRAQLPKITALSVGLRSHAPDKSGLTIELLTQFDRIYADSGTVDIAALSAELPQDFDRATRLVPMVRQATAEGSCLIVQ